MMSNTTTEIPPSWRAGILHLPVLSEVARWDLLRQWGLSEVWRITLHSGQTWIAKRACGSMAVELAIYHDLLEPMGVLRPRLHSSWQIDGISFFILQDMGLYTLEQQPCPELFMAAARELARLRCLSTYHLQREKDSIPARYRVTPDYFLQALDYLLYHKQLHEEQKRVLRQVAAWLPAYLQELYAQLPATLSHNDYHVKNLVIKGDTVVPIDWAMAFICPYHGDLYSLLRNAGARKVSRKLVLATYEEELQRHVTEYPGTRQFLSRSQEWQSALGGVCILITSIRWILYEASVELPESVNWIPKMLVSMERCASQVLAD